jgi:hypothetical protein
METKERLNNVMDISLLLGGLVLVGWFYYEVSQVVF